MRAGGLEPPVPLQGLFAADSAINYYDCQNATETWYCRWDPEKPKTRYGMNVGFFTFLFKALPDITFAIIVKALLLTVFLNFSRVLTLFEGWRFKSESHSSSVAKACTRWLIIACTRVAGRARQRVSEVENYQDYTRKDYKMGSCGSI